MHDGLSALLAGRGHHKGEPVSWRHYVYGLGIIARRTMRNQIQMAEAFRIAQAVVGDDGVDHYADWHERLTRAVGT